MQDKRWHARYKWDKFVKYIYLAELGLMIAFSLVMCTLMFYAIQDERSNHVEVGLVLLITLFIGWVFLDHVTSRPAWTKGTLFDLVMVVHMLWLVSSFHLHELWLWCVSPSSSVDTGMLHDNIEQQWPMTLLTLLLWARVAMYSLALEGVGPQVLIYSRILVGDVGSKFLPLILFPMLAFGLALHLACMGGAQIKEQANTEPAVFQTLLASFSNSLKLVLGQVSDVIVSEKQCRYPQFASILNLAQILLLAVLGMNVLIAMINETYAGVMNEATRTWELMRDRTICAHERRWGIAIQRYRGKKFWWAL